MWDWEEGEMSFSQRQQTISPLTNPYKLQHVFPGSLAPSVTRYTVLVDFWVLFVVFFFPVDLKTYHYEISWLPDAQFSFQTLVLLNGQRCLPI